VVPVRRVPLLLVLLVLAVLAGAATKPAAAAHKPACWQVLLNDWYDGRIDGTYPIHCYRDALKIVASRTDIDVYSNARQDILFALQQAIARNKGGGGPQDPTSSIYTADALPSFLGGPDAKNQGHSPASVEPYTVIPRHTSNAGPITDVLHSSSASSVPLPAIVLGAIAGLLLVLGGAAYVARRRQLRRQTLRPQPETGQNP